MLTLHHQVRLFTIGPDSDRFLYLSLTIYLFACCTSLERNVSLVLSDLNVQHCLPTSGELWNLYGFKATKEETT